MKSLSELEKLITELCEDYQRLNRICEDANELGMMDPTAIWETFGRSVKRNDENDCISWFIYENECGEKELPAGIGGKMNPIKTPKDLARLILKTQ
jgi:hypothetical protein